LADKNALPLDDLYREVVLDHYRHPRGRKPLLHPSCSVEGYNPSCGDQLHLALDLDGGQVKEAQVECQGCSISVASGSMLAEMVAGKGVDEVRRLIAAVKGLMQGKDPDSTVDLGDLEALEGVRKFPVRVKCALLAWTTLEEALAEMKDGDGAGPPASHASPEVP
jgi:nitrogen fixation protein NifU and related proteins